MGLTPKNESTFKLSQKFIKNMYTEKKCEGPECRAFERPKLNFIVKYCRWKSWL